MRGKVSYEKGIFLILLKLYDSNKKDYGNTVWFSLGSSGGLLCTK
jgi:hypothetical protein